jgi:hypothetical protein
MTAFWMGIPGEWLASVAQSHAEILILQIFSSSSFLTVPATRPHFSGCLDLEGDRGDLELVLVLSFKHKSTCKVHPLTQFILCLNILFVDSYFDIGKPRLALRFRWLYEFICRYSGFGTAQAGISIRFRARLGVLALKPPRTFCVGMVLSVIVMVLVSEKNVPWLH